MVRWALVSDTHIGDNEGNQLFGLTPYLRVQKVLEKINGLSDAIDFLVHLGDISADGSEKSYLLAEALFGSFKAPVYYVVGNHDIAGLVSRCLMKSVDVENIGSNQEKLDYTFIKNGVRFIFLDAKHPETTDDFYNGILGEEQLASLKRIFERDTLPVVCFLHFPTYAPDSLWAQRKAILLNGDEFHSLLLQFSNRVLGIFSGHIHRTVSVVKDAISYFGVGSAACQFNFDSGDSIRYAPSEGSVFSVAKVEGRSISVRNYTVYE